MTNDVYPTITRPFNSVLNVHCKMEIPIEHKKCLPVKKKLLRKENYSISIF